MIAVWVLVHGLLAIALLGAVTHQGLAVWRRPAPARLFVNRFRAVQADHFATAIVVLYGLTFSLGAWIYPDFVLDVKGAVAEYGMRKTVGAFQMKEHLAVIGLALLPAYWHYWRRMPLDTGSHGRRFLTMAIMACAWWNLVVGHVLDNVKGLT